MASQLADILYFVVALGILVSQAFILRSTHRGMRFARKADDGGQKADRRALEWAYAVVPAVGLVTLLWFSWKAMHPDTIQVRGVAPSSRVS